MFKRSSHTLWEMNISSLIKIIMTSSKHIFLISFIILQKRQSKMMYSLLSLIAVVLLQVAAGKMISEPRKKH